eukprot:SAG11_NODE_50_length_19992_cov_9.945157_1_plen_77_part_10
MISPCLCNLLRYVKITLKLVPKFGTNIILNLVSKNKSARARQLAVIPGRFDSLVVDTTNGDDRYGHHLWPGLDQHIR